MLKPKQILRWEDLENIAKGAIIIVTFKRPGVYIGKSIGCISKDLEDNLLQFHDYIERERDKMGENRKFNLDEKRFKLIRSEDGNVISLTYGCNREGKVDCTHWACKQYHELSKAFREGKELLERAGLWEPRIFGYPTYLSMFSEF